jgi:hypothetical protein
MPTKKQVFDPISKRPMKKGSPVDNPPPISRQPLPSAGELFSDLKSKKGEGAIAGTVRVAKTAAKNVAGGVAAAAQAAGRASVPKPKPPEPIRSRKAKR